MKSVSEAIREARAAIDIYKSGREWIVQHIDGNRIFESSSMDYFRARAECRHSRIVHALILLGWDDIEAGRAAYVADRGGRFEDAVRENVKRMT